MKKGRFKRWLWGAPLLLIALLAAWVTWQGKVAREDRDRELAALRALGTPTNAQEMRKLVAVDADDNAAPLYQKAFALLAKHGAQVPGPATVGAWSAADEARVRKWVADNRETLDVVKAAAQKPSCDFDRDWEEGFRMRLPEFADFKTLAKLIAKRAEIEAEAGRYSESMEWLDVGRAVARHADEPILIGMLVSIACESIVDAEFQRQLEVHGLQAPFRKAAAQFVARKQPLPCLDRGLGGEVIAATQFLDQVGSGEMSLRDLGASEDASLSERFVTAYLQVPMLRDGVAVKLLKHYRAAIEHVHNATDKTQSQLEAGRLLDNAALTDRSVSGRIVSIFLPVFAQAGAAGVALEAKRRMSRCALELWNRRAQSGRFPETLAPGPDSIDPFSGKPFVYQIDRGHVVLYSLGVNQNDDGGRRRGSSADDIPYAPTFKR